jgi:hypothetical protein
MVTGVLALTRAMRQAHRATRVRRWSQSCRLWDRQPRPEEELCIASRRQQPLIEKIRRDLEVRAAEIRRLVKELEQIEAALRALPMDGGVAQPG